MSEEKKHMTAEEAQNNLTRVVPMKYPFEDIHGNTVASVTMTRPKVRDKRYAFKKAENALELDVHIFTQICGLEEDSIDCMDDVDFMKLQKEYEDFLS